MNLTRIYSLRLLLSLLLLPFVATLVLAFLHAAVFPNTYFNDFPAVLLSWLVLLFFAHFMLSRMGENRFQKLDQLGWQFLQTNDSHGLSRVFGNLEKLFTGGLLSRKQHDKLEKLTLRRYFVYYQENIAEMRCRESLLKCMRFGVRSDEAYLTLKNYLFRQPALTLELVDLAEVLHEFRPEDVHIAEFMAKRYLEDNQKHHRAAYFYTKVLQSDGLLSAEIIELCLERVLAFGQKDTFAGWLYCRAYQHELAARYSKLMQEMYKTSQWYALTSRDDALANALGEIVSGFDEDMIAGWEKQEQARQQQQWSARLARFRYHIHQRALFWWDELVRYKKYALSIAGGVVLIFMMYWLWSESIPQTESAAETINPVISDSDARFALQVAALKSASRAQSEFERLRQAGLDASIIKPTGRSSYYRIRLGKYVTKNDALAQGEILRQKNLIRDFFVVNFAQQQD